MNGAETMDQPRPREALKRKQTTPRKTEPQGNLDLAYKNKVVTTIKSIAIGKEIKGVRTRA